MGAIAALLRRGTLAAGALLAAGAAAAPAVRPVGVALALAGLAVLVALPIGRLLIMFGAFRGAGDRPNVLVTAGVLVLIAATAAIGLAT